MIGSRAKMLKDDGWGKMGWIGTIKERSVGSVNVRIKWDNGKSYMHLMKNIVIVDDSNPNTAFQLKKLRKKGFKV